MTRAALLSALLLAAACGGSSGADSGVDAHPPCGTDHDCDDGMYCNGPSVCVVGVGCTAGTPPCAAGQLCSEATRSCTTDCAVTADADADGHMAMLCGGDDCDDADPNAYPGSTEVCDTAMHDEDCDPASYGFRDMDGDGYGDQACCNGTHCGTDCDDGVATVHPTQAETCNGRDDDCNGLSDDAITVTWTVDADRDGHGDATPGAATMTACMMPDGYASVADDCADGDAGRHPGLAEICDGIDNDCSLVVDDIAGGGTCTCTVGMIQDCGLVGRCMGATQSCIAGSWGPCSIAPVAETCNDVDDDCNGTVDDGLRTTCYADADGDTYAAAGVLASQQCIDTARMAAPFNGCPTSYTGRAPASASTVDCCDAEPRAFPTNTTAYTSASACTGGGGYDFNCDGSSTSDPVFSRVATCPGLSMTDCGTSGVPMYAASGWQSGPPGCGGTGTHFGNCYWSGSPGSCINAGRSDGVGRPCR